MLRDDRRLGPPEETGLENAEKGRTPPQKARRSTEVESIHMGANTMAYVL